jgi:hypothetical protein
MVPSPTLYRLKDIRDRHLILQSPTGGLRVVSTDNLAEGVNTPHGVRITTSNVVYTVTPEDYQRIKAYLASPN